MPFVLPALLALPLAAQMVLHLDLSGEWRRSDDDRPVYAQPQWDDRQWTPIQLPPSQSRPDVSQPVKAWWLRRSVTLPPGVDTTQLALTLGAVSEVYEVFVNGDRIGSTGSLHPNDLQLARSRTFPVPAAAIAKHQPLIISLRIVRAQTRLFSGVWILNDSGPYLLTNARNAPAAIGRWDIAERWIRQSPNYVIATTGFTLALLILAGWLTDRSRRQFLWLGLFLIFDCIQRILVTSYISPDSYPNRIALFITTISICSLGFQSELCLSVVSFPQRWLRLLIWPLLALSVALGQRAHVLWFPAAVLIAAIVREAWTRQPLIRLALPTLLFVEVLARMNRFGILGQNALRSGGLRLGDFSFEPQGVILIVTALGVAILLFRELLADRRERQRLSGELEAARAVQSLLLRNPQLRDARVDAVYLPAHEVGGDFYAVLDDHFLVAGDVSGKGLKAAMMVSLIIGALRSCSPRNPSELLAQLNRAILASGDTGFVTCICARFGPDGHVTLSNAGHPNPYRDGRELETDPSLPLGLTPDAVFSETNFVLAPGERLTFVSDGVVEAANASGELFGFDRTRAISASPAAEIAAAAKAWGQNDDITVLALHRLLP